LGPNDSSVPTLQHCAAERHEHAHKTNLKDAWNASNQNLNYRPQVFTFQHPNLYFAFRELNLQAFAQRWEISTTTCKSFNSSGDLAAPLSSQSYVKPELIGPQNWPEGNLPDSMIKDF